MQRRGCGARVERGEAGCDRRECGLRLATAFVEPDTERDEHRGAGERKGHARGLADPAVVHGHHDEEDGGDDDRDAADPAEDTTAEDLLEVAPRLRRIER